MEAKVRTCRAQRGKSQSIRIGVTLKSFKEEQQQQFEQELDRMMHNEQVLSTSLYL